MKDFIKDIRGAFLESDGTVSFARVFSAIVLAHVLGWITCAVVWVGYVAFKNKAVPDTTSLVALIGALSTFAGSMVGVLYGVNKVTTAYVDKNQPKAG